MAFWEYSEFSIIVRSGSLEPSVSRGSAASWESRQYLESMWDGVRELGQLRGAGEVGERGELRQWLTGKTWGVGGHLCRPAKSPRPTHSAMRRKRANLPSSTNDQLSAGARVSEHGAVLPSTKFK